MTPVLINGAQAGSYGVEMVQNKKNCTPDHFTVPLNGAITPKKQFIFNRNWSGICKMRNCEPLWLYVISFIICLNKYTGNDHVVEA